MEFVPFVERICQLKDELGMSYSEIGTRIGMHRQHYYELRHCDRGEGILTQTVDRFGVDLPLIPVVFVDRETGQVEDLDNPGFLYGVGGQNSTYRKNVLCKLRGERTTHEMARDVGVAQGTYWNFERIGHSNLGTLEKVAESCGLEVLYLYPQKQADFEVDETSVNGQVAGLIATLEAYAAVPTEVVDPDKLQAAIAKAERVHGELVTSAVDLVRVVAELKMKL